MLMMLRKTLNSRGNNNWQVPSRVPSLRCWRWQCRRGVVLLPHAVVPLLPIYSPPLGATEKALMLIGIGSTPAYRR